jgi:uncharacterized lipoprotein YmbA
MSRAQTITPTEVDMAVQAARVLMLQVATSGKRAKSPVKAALMAVERRFPTFLHFHGVVARTSNQRTSGGKYGSY